MDIDIDFSDRQQALNLIKHIPAAINRKGEWIKHNTGVFVTAIPADPITGMSSLDYKEAEDLEAFAKANNGSMDIILMQMAINFGYKLALENVQQVLDKDNEDEFEKEAREIENIEQDNN